MNSVRSKTLWQERRDTRRKAVWALLISFLFHIGLILLVALLLHQGKNALIAQKKEEQMVTMNLLSTPPPQYVDTHSNQATEKTSQQTPYESDKNTQAASELPATGQLPLPTLSGKESQGIQFENREYSPGKQSGGASASVAAHVSQMQQPQEKLSTPAPKTDLPILKPVTQQQTPSEEVRDLSRPQVSSQPSSAEEQKGYQPETRVIRIDGNISNRGRAAMEVAATPLGRYKKLLSNAVGARWYYLVQRDMDLYRIGTVVIRFSVQQNGKVGTVQIVSNTSNELLAATSIQSIKDAEMPPIPPDVAASLQQGRIEVDYTFSIISN